MGALIVLFTGILYPMGIGLVYLMVDSEIGTVLYLGIAGVISLVLSSALYVWLKQNGTKAVSML